MGRRISNMSDLSLRSLRRALEISQQQLADYIDVHVNTYIRWENHPENIPVGKAFMICEALHTTMDSNIFLPTESTKM
jgi:DNA-binding XRE family transcriptional regulator